MCERGINMHHFVAKKSYVSGCIQAPIIFYLEVMGSYGNLTFTCVNKNLDN